MIENAILIIDDPPMIAVDFNICKYDFSLAETATGIDVSTCVAVATSRPYQTLDDMVDARTPIAKLDPERIPRLGATQTRIHGPNGPCPIAGSGYAVYLRKWTSADAADFEDVACKIGPSRISVSG
jgi:hypothetical protein